MAVTAASLIDPAGPLTTQMFPGEQSTTLATRVAAYITAAATDPRVLAIIAGDSSKTDVATRAYALWRAYLAAVQRMNLEPLTVTVTERGSHGYNTAQIGAMQQLADQYDQQLTMLLPVAEQPVGDRSVSVANQFGW